MSDPVSRKKFLFIVEGERDEPGLIKRLWNAFPELGELSFHTVRTNIHVLVQQLYRDGALDTDLDVVKLIASKDYGEENPRSKRIVSSRYTDVFLIFDMDPQDRDADFGRLMEMMRFFNDSTDHGKMYLNYPMLESYRHIKSVDDIGFGERVVSLQDIRSYKKIVGLEGCKELQQINKTDRRRFEWIIKMHLKKVNRILTGKFVLPDVEDHRVMSGEAVLDAQLHMLKGNGCVFVLCTCVFCVVDYKPALFLSE